MKRISRAIGSLLTAGIAISMSLNFSACSKESPMAPKTQEVEAPQQLEILTFGNGNSLKKTYQKSQWIDRSTGGMILLEEEFEDGDYEVEVEVELKVLPYALSQSAELMVSVDDEQFLGDFDVVFHPHGVNFLKPAILNIEIEISDYYPSTSTLNLNNLDIYYDNPETGQWELMPRDEIEIEYDEEDHELEIEVENARLPHFSRYALGAN